MTKFNRRASAILAAVAGVMLTAGGAAAQAYDYDYDDDDDDYTSTFVDRDADMYDYYEGGFDETNADDDWFYDHYGLESDLGDEYWTAADDWGTDWGDSDVTDLGGDDAGDEGLFDF